MLDDDNTRPGDAKAGRRVVDGDGRLRECGLAEGVAQGHANRVRPRGRVGRVVVRGGKGVRARRQVEDSRGGPITPVDRGGQVCQGLASLNVPLKITESLGAGVR